MELVGRGQVSGDDDVGPVAGTTDNAKAVLAIVLEEVKNV